MRGGLHRALRAHVEDLPVEDLPVEDLPVENLPIRDLSVGLGLDSAHYTAIKGYTT